MCGIAGFWTSGANHDLAAEASAMAGALAHRGPDAQGTWADAESGMALGHRRLSIVDLSAEGSQPMHSASGRFVMVFNGEVYNFADLRRELEQRGAAPANGFRGHSDTEVMLACFEAWGLGASLERFVGMFAFALWDRSTRELSLVRDRVGIKPLYYGWDAGRFFFGSELKALRALPRFTPRIDQDALTLLLRHNCIPAPYSIYHGVRKLTAGTVLTVHSPDPAQHSLHAFWSALGAAERGLQDPFTGDDEEAREALDARLRDAVGIRMIADVPLGAFLSGGVDSSVVVALMQAQSNRPVKTFSLGFADPRYDEAPDAKRIATHLGTDHTEVYVTPEEALGVIPQLAEMYDEPFADSSQIPTYLVSRIARQHVTVSLSGDGGDELFAGYNRHSWVPRIWRHSGRWPRPVRSLAASALTTISPEGWDRVFASIGTVLPAGMRQRMPGYKIHRLAQVLGAGSPEEIYYGLTSHWDAPQSVVRNAQEPATLLTQPRLPAGLSDITRRMMFLDLTTYLPDDVLTKVDRASMATSLEARVPLLDHRIVEFAWRLSDAMRIRDGVSKWILRQVLYRYVPRSLIERPKMGFGLPLDGWLRGPLRTWAEDLLDANAMRRAGYLDPAPVQRRWREFLAGQGAWQYHIWNVLMFQAWLEAERGR